jgi:hypothetical protein
MGQADVKEGREERPRCSLLLMGRLGLHMLLLLKALR